MQRDDGEDYSHRLPSLLYTTGKSVAAGFEAQSKWKTGRLWETLFPSAKSELGAHRCYDEAANAKLERKFQNSVAADVSRRKLKEWRGLTSAATRF